MMCKALRACRSLFGPGCGQAAREEDIERSDPAEYERQKTEAYVRGGGNPAPAVVTFTSEAATMAVNELLAVGLSDERMPMSLLDPAGADRLVQGQRPRGRITVERSGCVRGPPRASVPCYSCQQYGVI